MVHDQQWLMIIKNDQLMLNEWLTTGDNNQQASVKLCRRKLLLQAHEQPLRLVNASFPVNCEGQVATATLHIHDIHEKNEKGTASHP